MRVLFLLTQDLESPSGLGRYLPLAKGLARLGHDVTISALHSNFDNLPNKDLEIEGVRVHYTAPMHVLKQGSQKVYYSPWKLLWITSRATWALTRSALTTPADIIHTGKPHPMNGIAALCAHLLKRRFLYVDCDDYEIGVNRFAGRWQRSIINFFEQTLPRLADRVSTNTYFTRDRLVRDGVQPDRIIYISNGVDRERLRQVSPEEIAQLKGSLGLSGRQVIGYIGSLSLTGHPVDLLVRAFQRVNTEMPNTRLLLVGGGEDIGTLKSLTSSLGLEECVVFTGRVPPEKASLYYRLADVTIDPVHDDEAARGRSPLKLFESWACGVPFITSDVGDRRRLLGDPPAGLLAAAGDDRSLAEAIRRVLEDSSLGQEISSRGRQRVASYYWDLLAEELSDDYHQYAVGRR